MFTMMELRWIAHHTTAAAVEIFRTFGTDWDERVAVDVSLSASIRGLPACVRWVPKCILTGVVVAEQGY